MKNQRQAPFRVCLLGVVLLLVNCQQYEVPPRPQPSPFSAVLEGGKSSFPAAGGTVNLLIDAGANGWWIVVPDEKKAWTSITKLYGAGNFTVPVTIRPNLTKVARSVEVTVNPSYQLPPVKLEIKQEG